MPGPWNPLEIGKQVFSDFSDKNVSFMAAGIAYNAFVSLAPLVILLLLFISVVDGGLETRLVTIIENSLPGPISDVITEIFSGESEATSVSVVGLVVLLWGTLKIFRGLDTAFSEIYETVGENTFVDKLVDGFVALVAVIITIVATVAVSAVFAIFSDQIPFVGFLTPVVLVVGLVLAFFPMYYRFPDTELGWRDVLPGTVFAALGWATLQAIFQVYLVFSGNGSENFFGGVIVVVTWLYFSGLLILLGAVLNAVIGGHSEGASGGIGCGAARDKSETESSTSMAGGELASYLRDFRTRLTGYYEEMEVEDGPIETTSRPVENEERQTFTGTLRKVRPLSEADNDVEIVERSRTDDGEQEWTVTFRWQSIDGKGDE
jgi:membrane protein